MTLVVGLSTLTRCVIVADSLATYDQPRDRIPTTAIGQAFSTPNTNDDVVKVFSPLANCILGLSGNGLLGISINDSIKSAGKIDTLRELYEKVLYKIEATEKDHSVLIIAIYDRLDSIVKMFKWTSKYPKSCLPGRYMTSGSGSEIIQHNIHLLNNLGNVINNSYELHDQIELASWHLNRELFEKATAAEYMNIGVGGVFVGIGLDQNGLTTQRDTVLLKAEVQKVKKIISCDLIFVGFRREVLAVYSSITKQVRLTSPSVKDFENETLKFDNEPFNVDRIQNIEIHTKYDNLRSARLDCQPLSLLLNDKGKLKFSKDLNLILTKIFNGEEVKEGDFS